MKTLVIGGTGLISTAIVRKLVERGDEVILFHRNPADVPGTVTVNGDRSVEADLLRLLSVHPAFDCVIDMIGYEPEPVALCIRLFRGKTMQYLFCSTVDVYAKPAARYPVLENETKMSEPAFSYAYNKVLCERLLEEAHERGDFAVTIIRPGATHQDDSWPIPLLGSGRGVVERIRLGLPILVPGDGTAFWVSAHRDDIGPVFAIAAGNTTTYGKSYHATGKEWLTWNEYYATVAHVLEAPPLQVKAMPTHLMHKIIPDAMLWTRYNFMLHNIFDNTAAERDLGYVQHIGWEQLVRRMMTHHGYLDKEGKPLPQTEPTEPDPAMELYVKVVEGLDKAGQFLSAFLMK